MQGKKILVTIHNFRSGILAFEKRESRSLNIATI